MSCAIANAVMDVIRDERLQDNAARVGSYLLQKCELLRNEFELVGDVRGMGLFVGIELIRDVGGRHEPATIEANFIVDRMKSIHHILISSDGPNDNVLKLKPPMLFSEQNANEFLMGVRECLHYVQTHEVRIFAASYL